MNKKVRKKFESWAKKHYKEQQMTILPDNHFTRPGEYLLERYQSAWEAWQKQQSIIDKLEIAVFDLAKQALDFYFEKAHLVRRLDDVLMKVRR